jgi:hypothetical protein
VDEPAAPRTGVAGEISSEHACHVVDLGQFAGMMSVVRALFTGLTSS